MIDTKPNLGFVEYVATEPAPLPVALIPSQDDLFFNSQHVLDMVAKAFHDTGADQWLTFDIMLNIGYREFDSEAEGAANEAAYAAAGSPYAGADVFEILADAGHTFVEL